MIVGFMSVKADNGNSRLLSLTFNTLNNSMLLQNINCTIYYDSLVVGIIPNNTNISALRASFVDESVDSILVNNVAQQSGISINNYNNPVLFKLWEGGSIKKTYVIKLIYTGLSVVYINTQNEEPIVSKDNYINGSIHVFPSHNIPVSVFNGNMEVRGRGNSTWSMPKKPYRIKLNSKASLLGMPSDKDWILLANYSDKTLMRNYLAFEASKRFGLKYTPRSQFVELVVNGQYVGNYLLCEQIKVATNRLNISELKKTDTIATKITGGYLLEVDARLDEDYWFSTNWGIPICFKDPDDIDSSQLNYVKSYFEQTENALFSPQFEDSLIGYANFIETETFIDWYLINELFKNNDAIFFSSVYMYKDRGKKLSMGPVWDFDIAAGNINYNGNDNPQGWWIRNAVWMNRLFQDSAFFRKVKNRWSALKSNQIQTLLTFADLTAANLEVSQSENFRVWPILDSLVWPNPLVTGSYNGEVSYLKNWLNNRINWIDSIYNLPVLKPFNLLQPNSNNIVSVRNTEYFATTYTWESSDKEIKYKFKLDFQTGNFSNPILELNADSNGLANKITLSAHEMEVLFQKLNLKGGDTIVLKWTSYAFLGNDSIKAMQNHFLVLVWEKFEPPFELISPATNLVLDIDLEADTNHYFVWGKKMSNEIIGYKCFFSDTSNNENSLPILIASNNKGIDTILSINSRDLQKVFTNAGYISDSSSNLLLNWSVYAYSLTDSFRAEQSRNISLRLIQNNFQLLEPVNESKISFLSESADTFRFSWTKSLYSISYKCLFDIDGITYSLNTNNSGRENFLTINSSFLEQIMLHRQLTNNYSKTANINWRVFAFNANNDSLQSIGTQQVSVSINYPLQAFQVSLPANNFASKVNTSSNDSLTFIWQSAKYSNGYKFVLMGSDADIRIPLNTFSTKQDTFLKLTVSYLDQLLASEGIKKGESLSLHWTVFASQLSNDSIVASNIHQLVLTRNRDLQHFELLSPQNGAEIKWINQDIKTVHFSWQSAFTNATYKVYFDLPQNNFISPIDSLDADASGYDTSLSINNKDIELMLLKKNIIFNDSIILKWKTVAYTQDDNKHALVPFLFSLKRERLGVLNKTNHLFNHLSIFPNPSNGIISIEISSNQSQLEARVYDLTGKECTYFILNNNTKQEIDLSKLSNGLYYLKIVDGDKTYCRKLLLDNTN